ncbi:MAG: YidC/Oxa1 family membrane protein insertase [Ruminococcaceae bacterium]|nr:YidC/Oxa1 family membrane protein insertase [Oscillospiraceae bacterium]
MFELFAPYLGQLMQWIYELVSNYFLALVLFTVLVRLVLFPLSISNQKNQMERARLAPRLERIQKKYGQDRQKMMQKQQELYEKEGVKMAGGCLPMIFQMLVLFSVIGVIYKPLTYIQDVPEQDIAACIEVVKANAANETEKAEYENTLGQDHLYRELNLFKVMEKKPELKQQMIDKIADRGIQADKTAKDDPKKKEGYVALATQSVNTIVETGEEFSIFGISLLEEPAKDGLIPNWLWIIAFASGISAFLSGKLSMKYSQAAMSAEQQAAGGCSTGMMTWMMPIMSLIFSFTVPAGVAVYWVFSNLLAMVQTVVLNKMYSPAKARAQAELEYAERRRRKKEEKERLRQIHLEEQAAWQKEENEKRAKAKGDITKKKKATTTATPAPLPDKIIGEIVELDEIDNAEEDKQDE